MAKKVKNPPPSPPKTTVELARTGVRLAAVLYDGLLIIAINAILAAILIGIATPAEVAAKHQAVVLPDWFRHFVLFPAMVLMTWVFYGYFWRKTGQTLGMQTWRLKVIKPNGQLLSWSDAFGRCAAAMILPTICGLAANMLYNNSGAFALSLVFGFVGNYLWAWINGRGLAWHDQLSATVVIRVPVDPRQQRGILGWFSKDED
ncbi:MAG: RDD family protein [Agitococcus sp.]|nr:RDD family protein [Agitococcus sp.]